MRLRAPAGLDFRPTPMGGGGMPDCGAPRPFARGLATVARLAKGAAVCDIVRRAAVAELPDVIGEQTNAGAITVLTGAACPRDDGLRPGAVFGREVSLVGDLRWQLGRTDVERREPGRQAAQTRHPDPTTQNARGLPAPGATRPFRRYVKRNAQSQAPQSLDATHGWRLATGPDGMNSIRRPRRIISIPISRSAARHAAYTPRRVSISRTSTIHSIGQYP